MTLLWKTKSDRSISIMKDRISGLLYHYHTGILQGRWAFRLGIDKEYHHGYVFSRQKDLAYDKWYYLFMKNREILVVALEILLKVKFMSRKSSDQLSY